MKKRAIGLVLLIPLLLACQRERNPDVESEMSESAIISVGENIKDDIADVENNQNAKGQSDMEEEEKFANEAEESIDDTPDFQNEYAMAIEAYRAFLAGELYYTLEDMTEETRITIAPNYGGKYTIIDMNDDGIPELVTNLIIYQFRDKEHNMYWSVFTSGIYSYNHGGIIEWYSGGDFSFELLSNKALLYEYEQAARIGYVYLELDSEGNPGYALTAYKTDAGDSDWKYYFNENGVEMKIASEEEWLDLLEPYFALRTDVIPWNDYSLGPVEQ